MLFTHFSFTTTCIDFGKNMTPTTSTNIYFNFHKEIYKLIIIRTRLLSVTPTAYCNTSWYVLILDIQLLNNILRRKTLNIPSKIWHWNCYINQQCRSLEGQKSQKLNFDTQKNVWIYLRRSMHRNCNIKWQWRVIVRVTCFRRSGVRTCVQFKVSFKSGDRLLYAKSN